MVVNCCLHAFSATIYDFDAISAEDFVEAMVFREMLINVDFKNICRFLWIHFHRKGD